MRFAEICFMSATNEALRCEFQFMVYMENEITFWLKI